MLRLIGRSLLAALACGGLLGQPAALSAQERGVVQGTVVLEEDGGAVHGAVVLIVEAGLVGLTDAEGAFEIDDVPPGSYEVLAQREHLTASRQMVDVAPGGAASVAFELGLSPIHEEVTVTAATSGTQTTFEAFNAVTTLDSFDIVRDPHATLGEVLQNVPGIASRNFGPGSSRPVIRGFDGDRVLVLEDGIRTGDLSATSGDHSVTVDPNTAERIEIVRGPATLLYGSNAVGGVVNIFTPHESFREVMADGTRFQFGSDAGSANGQAGANASLQHAQGNLLVWAGGSTRRAGDYSTPAGKVDNSAIELTNARAGVGFFGDRFFASGGFAMEDNRHGVPFAAEFHGGHGEEDEHGEEEGEGEETVDLDARRRAARFDIGLQNLDNRVIEGARVSFSVADWKHDELEIAGGVEEVGTRFSNRTYIMRADVDQRQTARLTGRFGAWMQVRDFSAVGVEALAPRTDLTSLAAFAYEELRFGRMRVQFGGRLERNDYRTMERTGGLHGADEDEDHGEEEEGEDGDHGEEEAPDPRDRDFLGASASVGLHADLGAGNAFVVNLTRSHRAPAIEELYNFGPHVGTLTFDIGNPNLDAETTLGLDLSLRHLSDRVRGNLNFFVYDIDNFIFGDRTDEILDNLSVFNFVQGDSRFRGFDARGSLRFAGDAWVTLGLGYVDARLTATDQALPRIPPLRGTLSLDIPYNGFTFGPELIVAGRQDRVYRGETETDGYSLLNVRASYVWPRQHTMHILTVSACNLTDTLYRNHSSYIKDLAPEMGRGIKVGYSVRFF